jgi:hypothetical protein
MNDIVEKLRGPAYWNSGSSEGHEGDNSAPLEAADEIERLRAEVATWQHHARTAIWSDSEECKLLTADNERLREALRDTSQHIRGGSDISGQFVYFINKYKAVPAINNMFSLWETSAALEASDDQ